VNLVLLEPRDLQANDIAIVDDARAVHIRAVLRSSVGQTIRIGLVDGPMGAGTVREIGPDAVAIQCTWGETPPRPRVDLLLAVPRPKVLRRLWAQLAALGVGRIILTNAARVERPYFDTHVLRAEHYRPLLLEGLQQARDTRLPDVTVHRQFKVLVEDDLDALTGEAIRLVAEPEAPASIAGAIQDRATPGGRVVLAVGPEGGWNEFELRMLQAHRFVPVGLGPRTLRTDTACVALLSLVHAAHDGIAPRDSTVDDSR